MFKKGVVNISIYYIKNGKDYKTITKKDFFTLTNEEREKYQILNVRMLELTWGIYNTLNEILSLSGIKEYKENKLNSLIVEWDAKEDNMIVPVSKKAIMSLSPSIAETILSTYDSLMFISREEEIKIARQVNGYIMSNGKSSSSISRSIIENDLIEEFHWLPQDIEKIPYKKLQEFFIVRREKGNARNAKISVKNFKDKVNSSGSNIQKKIRR